MNKPTESEINAFKGTKLLSLDIETKDPKLKTNGPGTHRGDGYICGVSFGTNEDGKLINTYLPLNHIDTTQEEQEYSRRVIKDVLLSTNDKIGANIVYDLEWLNHEGYQVNGRFHDVQYAEPLLNEYSRSFALDKLAEQYLNKKKKSDTLKEYCERQDWSGNPVSHLWRMPFDVVEEYALMDTQLPLEIFELQTKELHAQNLWPVYDMETRLIPLLLQMRRNGVRINQKKFKETIVNVTDQHYYYKEKLEEWSGYDFNPSSSKQLAKLFDRDGISYPRNEPTPLMREKGLPGNPKLDKDSLTRLSSNHSICKTILDYRHFDTIINLFLHPYLNFMVGDRLHCQFHPLRSDDYGTVSGRFSSSKPNLQQVSAKDEEDFTQEDHDMKGMVIRQLFIPEEDHEWAKLDYSQIEYRIMAHYASGKGAELLREKYRNDPETDYHKYVQDKTGFDRRTAKRLNFGGAYGLGTASASRLFNWTIEEAEYFMDSFHSAAPYIRNTRALVSKTATRRGHIFTLKGRKARTHPSRKIYSMFNRLIQGSAADIMKQGMVDAYEAGVFEVLFPHVTVHDEMDVSFIPNKEGKEALKELKYLMEVAIPLEVPVIVDCHTGINWAEAD